MRPCADYRAFAIGRRLRVVPPGPSLPPAEPGRLDLVVARGAFGSGEHETTASCLELLERLPGLGPATTVLDLGAGTGILGVAALVLGAGRAVLVDNDPRAIAAAEQHLALNAVADRARLVLGQLAEVAGLRFELILANLHADVLLELAPRLLGCAAPGACLVLSGILWEHNWDVRERYQRLGCELLENRFLDEYTTVLLRRLAA